MQPITNNYKKLIITILIKKTINVFISIIMVLLYDVNKKKLDILFISICRQETTAEQCFYKN